jgi:hypothetical protein
MKIPVCARCEGSGHLARAYNWELPWSRWVDNVDNQHKDTLFRPHACPDCGGTGALLEIPELASAPRLASRRGIRPSNAYAEHVAVTLQSQAFRS